jgi:aminoglycoside phosphotransferase (APT) family kinase protein
MVRYSVESFSKIPLSPEVVQEIVAHHFGSQSRLKVFEELKEGFYNAAAHLELQDGFHCVLKAAPPDGVRVLRYERDILRAEVEAMRLVREKTEAPTPEVFVFDTTHCLLPGNYYLMEFLSGIPFHKLRHSLDSESQTEVERKMGKMAAQISELSNTSFGYLAQPEPAGLSWKDCFAKMVWWVMQDGIDQEVNLPVPYPELFEKLATYFHVLDEVDQPRLVHWDLWDGNVFVDPKTLHITGLIDFERSMWGDPLIEAFFQDLKPGSQYEQGYGKPMLVTTAQKTRRRLYNVYLYLIMIIEVYYRRYPTPDQENWARAQLDKVLTEL